jgi:hypothetical protein
MMVKSENSNTLKPETGLQLWRTLVALQTSVGLAEMYSVKRETTDISGTSKNILKVKLTRLKHSTTKNTTDLYRGINAKNKGYQPTPNLERDEKSDLSANCNTTVYKWKNHSY